MGAGIQRELGMRCSSSEPKEETASNSLPSRTVRDILCEALGSGRPRLPLPLPSHGEAPSLLLPHREQKEERLCRQSWLQITAPSLSKLSPGIGSLEFSVLPFLGRMGFHTTLVLQITLAQENQREAGTGHGLGM